VTHVTACMPISPKLQFLSVTVNSLSANKKYKKYLLMFCLKDYPCHGWYPNGDCNIIAKAPASPGLLSLTYSSLSLLSIDEQCIVYQRCNPYKVVCRGVAPNTEAQNLIISGDALWGTYAHPRLCDGHARRLARRIIDYRQF
jgi:hypothetical protein